MGSPCSNHARLEHPVSPARPAITPTVSCRPGSSIPIDGHSSTKEKPLYMTGKEYTNGGRPRVTIDMLPDIALLGVFDFYMDALNEDHVEGWHTLVHVCRKWRIVVFGSPRRLKLQLLCTTKTPIRQMLDVWPLLPIVVWSDDHETWGVDSIFAALEHRGRICELDLADFPISRSQIEKVLAEMQQAFPTLTRLYLPTFSGNALILPAPFLGGAAPQLQLLQLCGFQFPGLSKLLLSAAQLVYLDLCFTSSSDYFSPETLLSCLSVLTKLKKLKVEFESPQSLPDQRGRDPPFPTRAIFPALTKLWFEGVTEYLEGLLAQVEAPLLDNLTVTFPVQPIFNTPQLIQFVNRTPKLKAHDEARIVFDYGFDAWVTLPQKFGGKLRLETASRRPYQLWSLALLCSSSIPRAFISAVEHLYIVEGKPEPSETVYFNNGDIEDCPDQWFELLGLFTAVKSLYISREFSSRIAYTLQKLIEERETEVLPALQTLFLEERTPSETVQEAIGEFVAARQLVGHPIAISHWNCTKDVWDEMDDNYVLEP